MIESVAIAVSLAFMLTAGAVLVGVWLGRRRVALDEAMITAALTSLDELSEREQTS